MMLNNRLQQVLVGACALLYGCSTGMGAKSVLVSGAKEIVEWNDTIPFVVDGALEDKDVQLDRRKLLGFETERKEQTKVGTESNDLLEALNGTLASIIEMSGHYPKEGAKLSEFPFIRINKFSCTSTTDNAQEIIVVQSASDRSFPGRYDGSSSIRSEKCELVISQNVKSKVISQKSYRWASGDKDDSGNMVDLIITDFTKLKSVE